MYGTVAKVRVKPENRETLREVFERQEQVQVPGYVNSYMLWEDGSDIGWMFVVFEDRESYHRNANDPAQNERYQEFRALMEDNPEWHDGEIESS
jgi:quinol monooxygenase YgiN